MSVSWPVWARGVKGLTPSQSLVLFELARLVAARDWTKRELNAAGFFDVVKLPRVKKIDTQTHRASSPELG